MQYNSRYHFHRHIDIYQQYSSTSYFHFFVSSSLTFLCSISCAFKTLWTCFNICIGFLKIGIHTVLSRKFFEDQFLVSWKNLEISGLEIGTALFLLKIVDNIYSGLYFSQEIKKFLIFVFISKISWQYSLVLFWYQHKTRNLKN